MSMMDEIEKMLNSVDTSINYRVVNLGGNKMYIEGIKSVVSLGLDKMTFQLKNKILDVAGQNLGIKYLDKQTCILSGKITKVEER